MRKFVVIGVAAVVVGLLYIASNIFLMYDANGTLHQEIAELQVINFLLPIMHRKQCTYTKSIFFPPANGS
jgi:hypothetical protein